MNQERSELGVQEWTALLLLYFVWGSTYLAIRIAIAGIPPLLLVGARYLIAGVLLAGTMRLLGKPWPTRAEWKAAACIGPLLAAANALVSLAEVTVTSGLTAVVVASVPLWIALLAGLFGKWPQKGDWVGLGIGLVGVGILNFGGDLRGSPMGGVLLVVSTWCWALGSVWGRSLPLPRGLMGSGAQMITGGVFFLTTAFLHGDRLHALPARTPLLAFVYLVFAGSIVGFSSYVLLLERVRPTLAASYAYVNPIVAVVLGGLIADERISPNAIFAMALILAGVAIVATRKNVPASAPAAAKVPEAPRS